MKHTLVPVSLTLPESPVPRSKGVHVSGVIRAIAQHMGVLTGESDTGIADKREINDPLAILRMSIGLAWEEWYLPQIPGVNKHPGEIKLDGIAMSPDGIETSVIITPPSTKLNTKTKRIHEVKATYKSCNTVADIVKQWLWLTQIKAYCKGVGTTYASLHVLFLCGDYKMPIRPQICRWDLEFTQAEIDSTWKMITGYKEYVEG